MKTRGVREDATSPDIDDLRREHQAVDRKSGSGRGEQGAALPRTEEEDCDESGPEGGYGGTGPDQQHPNRKVGKAQC